MSETMNYMHAESITFKWFAVARVCCNTDGCTFGIRAVLCNGRKSV